MLPRSFLTGKEKHAIWLGFGFLPNIISKEDTTTIDDCFWLLLSPRSPHRPSSCCAGKPYVLSDDIADAFRMYNNKDTGEHAFTVHQGGLTLCS